ncbi:basic helix-loop-helix protein A [Lolium perenne]|uniref:basic helix-loop-helix protein A n=1 Tax=Lolium perenne TaxID=4522 RepID=UPI0021F64931|nr:transcription factor BHLH42 [Lolium perenne]
MANSGEVQESLQAVAQGLRWTYVLLWQLCPDQGALVWAEGHYNGAIKTRKTVQPAISLAPAPAEAADHHRSRQLRELFDSLAREAAAGGTSFRDVHGAGAHEAAARRPSAALAPEDLTETEWFYLMCASYSFPPGVGLPGKAFATGGHVWLSRANEVDSKVFSRAILAKSAGIQTVLCIPIVDGVLEMGTTEKVEEDIGLIQYAMSIFMDQQDNHMIPTMSEHSTSNQTSRIDLQPFQIQRKIHAGQAKEEPKKFSPKYEDNEMEDGDDEIEECASGSETNTAGDYCRHAPLNIVSNDEQATHNIGSSKLMQLEMSERVRDGSSSNSGDGIQTLMVFQNINNQSSMQADEPSQSWHFLYEELCTGYPQSSDENQAIVSPENAHYTETVLSILHGNTRRQAAEPNIRSYLAVSHQSSFSAWHPTILGRTITERATPQRLLKSVLLNAACSSHCKPHDDPRCDNVGTVGLRREVDFSGNHVLQERKRREKLNERFIILRSLVPFVTKNDKASILGDTIEYVKQLRKRIQDLESWVGRQVQGDPPMVRPPETKSVRGRSDQRAAAPSEKRKLAALEGSSSSSSTDPVTVVQHSTDVQVSIIESDALLELRCPDRRGLLVRIMQALQEQLRLEVTAVQASSDDGVLLAELRAKVREVRGRRSCISEVKRAIHLIISSG